MLNPYTMHNSLALGEEEFNIVPKSFNTQLLEVGEVALCAPTCYLPLQLPVPDPAYCFSPGTGASWEARDGVHYERHLGNRRPVRRCLR